MTSIALGDLMPSRIPSVDPGKYPNETFELWSIPAFDAGAPEVVKGAQIGSQKKCVEPNDVLLSRIVPHIRRSCVVGPYRGNRQVASGEWITFRDPRFYPPYLRHMLTSDPFHAEFMQTVAGVGGSLLRARPEGVKSIKIPLPPLEEQKRIAAILDQADALRRLRRRALDRLNTLGQAIFHEMFGDPAANSHSWEIGVVGDLLYEARYGTAEKANTDGKGLPVLRMGNLTYDGRLDLTDLKHVELPSKDFAKFTTRPGDILFNRTNSKDLVGKTAVIWEELPFAFAGYLVRGRVNGRGHPDYVSAYLNSTHGKAVLRGMCKNIVGMANINAKEFQSIPIALPPRDLQITFADKIRSIRDRVPKMEGAIATAEALFTSLQYRAFRGEL